jgi:hypothetical protein
VPEIRMILKAFKVIVPGLAPHELLDQAVF